MITIDYAAIGAKLDINAQPDQLSRFAKRHGKSTDPALYTLAQYASFKLFAVRSRLEGNISDALEHEANCEAIYKHDITPANRW